MKCKFCSTNAQTLTTWSGKEGKEGKPVIYAVWQCEQGHHFYTQSKSEGLRYVTEFVEPRNMHLMRPLF